MNNEKVDNLEYVKNEMLPAIDGQVTGSYIKNASPAVLDSDNNRHFTFKYNPYYGGFVASGQSQIPLLSTSNSANATIPFRDEIAKAFDSLGTNSSWGQLSGGGGYGPMDLRPILRSKEYLDSMYYAQSGDIYIIDRPVAKDLQDNIIDVSNGGVTLSADKAAILLKNPTTLDGKWPAGTTFTWVSDATGKTPVDPMTFDKAGETKHGFLKVHLPMPNGINDGQQKRWFDGVIEVTAQSKAKTYNPGGDFAYGESKTAAELVQNKSAFPDGTTFHYAGIDAGKHICYQNSDGNWVYDVKDSEGKVQQVAASGKVTSTEPDWTKWGEYANVYIYADYDQTDVNGNVIGRAQSTPSHGIVTIDRFVNYYVVEGGDLPTDPSTLVQFDDDTLKDNELTFSNGFTQVGSDAAANLSNEKSNQAQFTVNVKNKKLGTTNIVKVYLNVVVIPKIDGVNNQWFNGDGSHNQDVDTAHQTGDYTIANKQAASKLTDYTAADASYIGYDFHKDPNNPNEGTFSESTKTYQPGMTVTGLSTTAAGELTGGKQTATVRIDVPKGTHGGNGIEILTDEKGNSYYNLIVPINVIFKGEITLSGPQTVTYNGEAQKINQEKAKGKYLGTLDISNPSSDKNVDEITKVSVELTADDLQFLDENGDPLTTPVINAGTYPVLLTESGVDKVEKEIAEKSEKTGYKYDFSDEKPNIADFVVEKAKVEVTVSAAGKKTYDGKAVTDFKPSLTITTVNGKEPLGPITLPNVSDVTKLGLIAGKDYEWYLSDAKGNKIGSALTGAPINAGNYTIGLTESGQNKIANLNKDNIEWTVKTAGPYVIEKAETPVTFTSDNTTDVQFVSSPNEFDPTIKPGSAHGYFNPQAMVDGSSTTSVVLQKVKGNPYGYYAFIDKDGKQIDGLPTENGSYKVILTEKGMAKVKELFTGKVNFNNYEMVNQAVGVLNVVSTSAMIKYVDADNNDEPLDVQYTQVIAGEPNTKLEFGDKLRIPEGYKLAINQPTSVTLGALGSNTDVTIKLVHNHNQETESQDFTFTVDYKYANGDKAGQAVDGATPAQAQGHYTRTKDTDLANGKVTYSDWKLAADYNENGFTNGYKWLSGDWSQLEDGEIQVGNTPTVDGYVAFTNVGTVNTNLFTPVTATGDVTQTVYYAQVQTEGRTVTAEFHKWENGQDTGEAAPSAQIQVFFKNVPTQVELNADGTTTVTYGQQNKGNWSWDNAAGDKDTPGFHVISGTWSRDVTLGTGPVFGVTAPTVPGYTAVTSREDSAYSTVVFASPTQAPDTVFTGDTDPNWYNRNKLVTFYVPNEDVSKTITRTIEITNPDGTVSKVPQVVAFTRTGKINKGTNTSGDYGDTAVILGDWTSKKDTWDAQDVSKPGYTAHITQTVDGQTTTPSSIDQVTVTPESKDTTVTVSYSAEASATLSGSASSPYTGSAISWDDVNSEDNGNIKVTVKGPNAGDYKLQQGDVEFSANGKDWSTALPTNAGTYQIHWTQAGIANVKKEFGNASITWGDKDANIKGSATYTINAASVDVTLSGSGTKVYDGQPVSTTELNNEANGGKNNIHAEIQVSINGTITSIDYILQDGDYTWVDYPNPTPDNGHPDYVTNGQAPTDVEPGQAYQIQLNRKSQTFIDHITAAILKQNPDLEGNFEISSESSGNQDTTFTITPAPAKLEQTGSADKTYDGKAGSVTLEQLLNNLKPSLADGKPLYGDDTFNTTGLTLGDFDWYNSDTDLGKVSDDTKAPVNAGHYTIKLNQDGLDKIAGWGDTNYNPNYSFLTGPEGNQEPNYSGAFKYDINQADGTVSIKNTTENNYSKPYDGQPTTSVDMSKLTVTAADGKTAVIDFITSDLTNTDFVFTDAEGNVLANQPTAAGTYYIKLTDAGLAQLNKANPNYKLTYDNSLATYQITQANLTVKQGGSSNHAYTGSALSPELSDVLANLTATAGLVNGESLNTSGLTLADFDWTDQTAVGDYTLKLNAAGLKKLQDNNKNYSISAVTGAYTFTINKANGTAVFGGSGTKTYDGSAIANYKPTITVTAPDTATTVDLTAGTDYVWYLLDANGNKTGSALTTAPAAAGNYSVELTTAGKGKITALNADNIDWTGANAITGTGSYIISKATATVNFANGSGQTVDYSGQTGKFDASKFTPSITTNNGQTLTIPEGVHLSLADGDFTINGAKTTTEPVALGTYTIGLSKTGFAKLQSATDNYNWENTATANYVVKANDKATVTVTNNVADGGHQTVVYKSSAFGTNDINLSDYALTLPTGLTYQLQAGDLELVGDPINVGTYTIQLSAAGKANLQKAGGTNFEFDFSKPGVANTTANFEITKATPNVTFNGLGSKTFGQNDETWTTPVSVDLSKVPGVDPAKQSITLANGDYEFVGQDGTVYQSVPTNAGKYTVRLTDQGKGKITASTINSANLDWAKAQISGEGSFTVNAVAGTAKLSGTNSRDYNGSAVTTADINNGVNIVVTIAIPNSDKTISYKLADGDYTWKDNADTTNVGTYTIELNKANILAHLQAQIANDPAWKGNVTLTDADLSGMATFTINQKANSVSLTGNKEVPYTGKAVQKPIDDLRAALKAGLINNDKLDLSGLFTNGFDWYDETGTTKLKTAPTDVGSYTIKLNDSGLRQIQRKNPNYKFSIGKANSYGFRIKPATGHVAINQDYTKTYSGTPNNKVHTHYTLTLTTDPTVTDQVAYTLQAGDLIFTANGKTYKTPPVGVGTYKVTLSSQGWANLKKANNSANINWVATEANPVVHTYTITPYQSTAELSGTANRPYNGSAVTITDINKTDSTIGVTINLPNGQTTTYKLAEGDYTWVNGSAPTNVGNYQLSFNLTEQGKAKLQNWLNQANVAGLGLNNQPNVLAPTKVTGNANFEITAIDLTVAQGGQGEKTYDGAPASVATTTLTNTNNWTATGLLGGQSLSIPSTLAKTDFDWYQENADGSETKLDAAPTDAGSYALKLNESGLTKLKNANKNYNVSVSGKYSYTINQANAVISLDPNVNKQESTWTGSAIAVNPTDFVPSIKDSSNDKPITLPNVQLTADDYTVAGNPVEPGDYKVSLTEAGWKKVANAVTGTGNYNWSYSGNGTLTITKKQQAITISGSQTVTYTGDAAILPTNADGTLKGYMVELGNGLTYQLKAGDLEFVKAEHTNAGTYKLKLSDAGLENIKKLAEGNHYDYSYTYDEVKNSAELIVEKATASYQLSGSQSSVYGEPVAIDLAKGTYTISLTTNNGQTLTYQLQAGDLAFENGTTPTKRGRYNVVLSAAGLQHLQALNANYTWDAEKSTSTAYYQINPAEMFVGLGGATNSVYNNAVQPVPTDKLADLHLVWGGSDTIPSDTNAIDLQADDFDYYQKQEDGSFKKVEPKDAGKYYLVLNETGLNRLNAANPTGNYTFTLNNNPSQINYGTYTIDKYDAKVTLTGSQSAEYGYAQQLDVKNFHLVVLDKDNNQIIQVPDDMIAAGDLIIKGQPTTTAHPNDVGTYDVEITDALLQKLEKEYPNINFEEENVSSGTDSTDNKQPINSKNNDGKYIITTIDAYISINGNQSVYYNPEHSYAIDSTNYSVTLKDKNNKEIVIPDDIKSQLQFEFVTAPTDAGDYQVKLTPESIKLINGIGTNNPNGEDNYAWHDDVQPQKYVVNKVPVTGTLVNAGTDPASSIYGKPIDLDNYLDKYKVTLLDQVTNQTVNYTLQKGDLIFVNGDPTTTGTFDVKLSQAGVAHLKAQYPESNYTLGLNQYATFKVTAATPTITITANGESQKTYDANPAEIKPGDFTISITTNNGHTIDYSLNSDDLQFVGQTPTNVGQYDVTIKQSVIDNLKQQFPNYNWDASSITGATGKFTISPAAGSAELSGSVTKPYDGTGISDLSPITVTVNYPGVGENTSYQLTASDFVIVNDVTGTQYQPSQAPADVGNYHIELTAAGKANIAKLGNSEAKNINWTDASYTGRPTYTISAIAINVTGKGQTQTATYDGSSFGTANKLDLDKFAPTLEAGKVTVPTIPTGTLTNKDYTIKDKDGNVVTDPTKAGDYSVWLNEDGLKKLSDLSSNFTWPTEPVQMGTLTINQAEVSGTLSGSNSKTYDGDDVSTTDINQKGGNITVQVTVNGVTYNYSLQDGDYTWNTKDGQAPTAAGEYKDSIQLDTSKTLIDHLTEFINKQNKDLAGNFKIEAKNLTGSASFTINKKDATVSLGGSDSKAYDGTAGSVTLDQLLNNLSSKDLVDGQTLDTTGLTLDDFTWSNPDHTAAGNYTISLTPTGLEKLQKDNPNYNISVEGNFAYTINKSAASAVLSGLGEKTYNGDPVSSADLQKSDDKNNITVSVTIPGQTDPQTVTLGVNDFDWDTPDGKAPTNAGAYTITINDKGKQAIEDQFASNQNIDWTKSTFTGEATYKINKAAGTINFTGSDGKDFDNKEVTSLDKDKFYVTVNGNKVALPDDGFEIVDKSGKQVTPKDAGTYYIVLTDKGLQELQKDSNYSWTPNWNGNTVPNEIGTYVINQTKATPSLSGETNKTYNGDTTTLAEVTKDGKITVSVDSGNTEFTIPNYVLTADDYEWLGTDGQKLSAPKSVGKYIIKLNATGLQNIQAYLDKTYGQGNVLVDSTKDSGQANFEITPFEVTVTINGTATVGSGTTTIPDGKYSFNFDPSDELPTGWEAPTLSASELEFTGDAPTAETKNGTFTVNYKGGQAALQELLGENYQVTYNLASNNYIVAASTHVIDYQDKDGNPVGNQTVSGDPDEIVPFTPEYPAGWKPVDPASVPTTVPVDGGTTTIIVEHKVITVTPDDPKTPEDNLPDTPGKDYPDGNKYPAGVSESDLNKTITRTIIEKLPSGDKMTEQKVTFTRTATVDLVTGEVKYGDWTKESGAWDEFTPETVPGYTASPSGVEAEDVTTETKDQTVTINYTANVADEQTVTIKFVDDDKGGSQVGDSITKNGKTGENVQLGLSVPENYKLAEGQTLPTDYTFTSAKDQMITIHLVHQTSEVDGNSSDIPEAIKQQLNDEVTRTINYEGLSADQLAQLPAGQKNGTKQTVKFVGSATYDPVDKKLVGDITWKAGNPASYEGFTPKSFPGYTASVSEVPNFAPKQGDKDSTVTISYTANDQTGKISYVDGDGNEISSTPLTGKTGETVTVTPKIPAGWKVVPGQDIPETVTATPDGIPTVTITIQHKKITVTPDDPKTPEDKLPETPGKDYPNGSKYPTGVAKDDLNKDVTRTIKVHLPNGSVEQHEQTVHLTRNAVVDLVTGEVTYGAWSTGKWDAFTPQAIDGYTVKPATVSAMTVTAQTTDQTVEINYQKNDTPAPTPVPVQESKEVTETIKYQFADGTEAAPSQVVKIKFTRSGLKDPASGKVTWNEWEPATHAFNAVTSPQIAGYQPDIAIVEKQEVTADSADLNFVVKYVKNDDKPGKPTTPDEPGKPDNPNKPDNPGEPDNPNKPDNPGEPDNPTNPDKPGKPDNPTNPGEPGTPDNPSNPDQPGIPDNPSQPGTGDEDKPGNPTIPDNPSTPNKPDKPSDTDNPGTGEEGKPDTPGKPTPGTPEGPDNGTPLTPDTEKESGSLPVPGDRSPEDSTPSDEKLVSDKQPSNVATDKQNAAKNGVNAKQLPQTGNESGKAAAITGISLLGVLALCFGFGKKRRDD